MNPLAPSPARPTRHQVSRACDWCRVRRVKCDEERPCRACIQRNVQCIVKGAGEPKSLPQALREIERLRNKVREQEEELEEFRQARQAHALVAVPTPSGSTVGALSVSDGEGIAYATATLKPTAGTRWQGIFVATARSEHASYYGPSSTFYFISRMGAYMAKAYGKPCPARNFQPRGLNRSFAQQGTVSNDITSAIMGGGEISPSMSRIQEEFFMSRFWEYKHCALPILDEDDFRRHYNSLWEAGERTRKASALVDIILAVCIQHCYSLIPSTGARSAEQGPDSDATIAGRWHYRRCQSLLAADMESPSITTVQCHIYSTVYLYCASFMNTAHATLALAIRQAEIIGLHLEPPASMQQAERELRKRIWWVICVMETKNCTKLGRPLMTDSSCVTVTVASDSREAAALNGARLGAYSGDVTWLTYVVQCQKLCQVICSVHLEVWAGYGRILAARELFSPYTSPEALEECAAVLLAFLPNLQTWADQVPWGLRTARSGGGRTLSTDCSPLAIETLAPNWLQRQRLYLELIYHTLATNLYRPFVSFYHGLGEHYTPTAERHAAACVSHAIAVVLIMHQAVTETDLMVGWHEYFSGHWDATVTIIGFIFAHPVHPLTARARRALDKSAEVCGIMGEHFCVAKSAEVIARDVMAKVDDIMASVSSGIFGEAPRPEASELAGGQSGLGPLMVGDRLDWLEPGRVGEIESFDEFINWALTVDSFNSFEDLFSASGGKPCS